MTLNGAAYANQAVPAGDPRAIGLQGYNAKLDSSWGLWLCHRRSLLKFPTSRARVSLTYNSSIEHDFDTTESSPCSPRARTAKPKVKTPAIADAGRPDRHCRRYAAVRFDPLGEVVGVQR